MLVLLRVASQGRLGPGQPGGLVYNKKRCCVDDMLEGNEKDGERKRKMEKEKSRKSARLYVVLVHWRRLSHFDYAIEVQQYRRVYVRILVH